MASRPAYMSLPLFSARKAAAAMPRTHIPSRQRHFSTSFVWNTNSAGGKDAAGVDVAELLNKPTWSVSSLLSDKMRPESKDEDPIASEQLRHLLRLSALPFPSSHEEREAKIDTLRTQLHFVRDVQAVSTSGLRPLQSIRDETREGLKEQVIGVKNVEKALLREGSFGHNGRPRRQKSEASISGIEDWDVMDIVPRKAGKYIVVNGAEQ